VVVGVGGVGGGGVTGGGGVVSSHSTKTVSTVQKFPVHEISLHPAPAAMIAGQLAHSAAAMGYWTAEPVPIVTEHEVGQHCKA
jgi:hypothetical protein